MVEVEINIEPTKRKSDALEFKEALMWALYEIDLRKTLDIACRKMEEFLLKIKKMKDEEAKGQVEAFRHNIESAAGSEGLVECPVEQINEVDTNDDKKVVVKLEITDEFLGSERLFENEFFLNAIADALLSAEKTKIDVGEGEVSIVKGKRIVRRVTKMTIPKT